ncbi:membrane protein [Ligilactobacillus acidipiscis]|nr:membrane protein [Ligilactobacillus acidipiscis]
MVKKKLKSFLLIFMLWNDSAKLEELKGIDQMSGKNMKSLVTVLILLMVGAFVYIFTIHDAFMYDRDIGQITRISNGTTKQTEDEFKNIDHQHSQKIVMVIKNGKYQGKKVHAANSWTDSGAFDQKFHTGQQVFVDLQKKNGRLTAQISDYKRDTYLIMLSWLVVSLLILTMRFKGLKTLLSVALNFVVFLIFVNLDVTLNLTNFFWLFVVSAFIFTALSLVIVIGWNKQCAVTFGAIVAGTAAGLLIGILVLNYTGDDLHYEALDFATQLPKQLFLSATVIGLLGAVMDAATDIVSTVFEIRRAHPHIKQQQLFSSGLEVGRSILGPLINVLLLIFFAETFAMGVLFFRTGNSIGYTFEWTMSLGIVQSLISGIGIALVVPAASGLASLTFKRGHKVGND